jgi:prepilin-type processing-associated H-X9-DG protein
LVNGVGGSIAQRWPCNDGGSSHISTIIPINYSTPDQTNCVLLTLTEEQKKRSYNNWAVSWGFKSRHPGGANFLFGDGSVRFLPEDINHELYQLLGCRHDRKHIEEVP